MGSLPNCSLFTSSRQVAFTQVSGTASATAETEERGQHFLASLQLLEVEAEELPLNCTTSASWKRW